MGTWMGLCCLLVTRSSFSSNDLQVASRACSLASMLSNRKQIVWLMEYRNDCKWKKETAQKGCRDCRGQLQGPRSRFPTSNCIYSNRMGPAPGLLCFRRKHVQRPGQAFPRKLGSLQRAVPI